MKFLFLQIESSADTNAICRIIFDVFLLNLTLIRLGVGHLVTTTCKDVCGKYSGDEGGVSGVADQIADAGKTHSHSLVHVEILKA